MGRVYDATWGRAFAACYDRGLKAVEEAGLREVRREVLSAASGRTIDLGAGTGVNLDLFPDAVEDLVLVEPDPHMAVRLRRRLASSGAEAEVVEAPAERLPFEDACFDTAVFTLVLCTVPDPAVALAETARILRPGGRMLFVEHVRSDRSAAGPLAGSAGAALGAVRERLPPQPRHGGADRGLPAAARGGRERTAAEGLSDRQADGPRRRLAPTPIT